MSFIFFFASNYVSFVLLWSLRNNLWALKVHSPFHRRGCELILVSVVSVSNVSKWMESLHELIRSFLSSVELSREHAGGERNCRDSHRELWGRNSRSRCDSFMIREPTAYRELSLRTWFSFTYCAESGAVSVSHSLRAEELGHVQ